MGYSKDWQYMMFMRVGCMLVQKTDLLLFKKNPVTSLGERKIHHPSHGSDGRAKTYAVASACKSVKLLCSSLVEVRGSQWDGIYPLVMTK